MGKISLGEPSDHNSAQNAVIARHFDEFVELNCGRNSIQRKYVPLRLDETMDALGRRASM